MTTIHYSVARMFVQATRCKHGKSTYLTYLVRESFRTPKGPRSRTVCNITALPPQTRELISLSLRGCSFVDTDALHLAEAWNFGGIAVLHQAWQDFGLDGLFSFVENARNAGLLKAMILGRILFPSAKLALADHARGTLLAVACGLDQANEDFDEDDLYGAMDQLNGHWAALERQLYQQSFGNRADTTTLQGLLATLRRRFGIKEAVFVFDGGMSSRVNLEAMETLKLKYVTRLSASVLDELVAELPADQSPELWDRTQVMEIVREGNRYIIAGGPWRQQRDQQRRQARLAKAEAELKRMAGVKRKKVNQQKLASQVGRMLQRLKAHKYFEYTVDEQGKLQWSLRDNLIKAEKNRDGLYLLGTNASKQQISNEGVLSHYKNLLEVEDAFCHLKSYLQVRPVFHWRPDRVRNHVRICFVAYWLTAKLERHWRQQDQTIEVHNLLRQLQSIRLGSLKVAGKTLKTKITDVPKDLNPVLNKLGLLPLFSQPPAWAQGVA